MTSFDKAYRSVELIRLESVLAQQERTIRRAFMDFLNGTHSDVVLRQIRLALEAGDFTAALSIVETHIIRFGTSVTRAFIEAATDEAAQIANRLRLDSALGISFDPTNPRAASLMRNNQLRLIQQFTEQQRAATRTALVTGLEEGWGTSAMARAFRDSIGLTVNQVLAVENYRTLLEDGSTEALQRDLRNRRFDPTIERAFERGEPLTQAQIDRMVNSYYHNAVTSRAETISRTEALRSVNQAREEASTQVYEQAGIQLNEVVRTWRSTGDHRVRDTHAMMDGQEQVGNAPFESPSGALLRYPGDPDAPASETINCRCVVLTDIRAA